MDEMAFVKKKGSDLGALDDDLYAKLFEIITS